MKPMPARARVAGSTVAENGRSSKLVCRDANDDSDGNGKKMTIFFCVLIYSDVKSLTERQRFLDAPRASPAHLYEIAKERPSVRRSVGNMFC